MSAARSPARSPLTTESAFYMVDYLGTYVQHFLPYVYGNTGKDAVPHH